MEKKWKDWTRVGHRPYIGNCFIWNEWGNSTIDERWEPTGSSSSILRGHLVNSTRSGGNYMLWQKAKPLVENLNEQQKARLTTWLVDQRVQGDPTPEISPESLKYAIQKPDLQVHERAKRLLKLIVSKSDSIGAVVDINRATPSPYAWSASTKWEEVVYLLNYLRDSGWLNVMGTGNKVLEDVFLTQNTVTVAGFNHIAELESAVDSTQAFVAMWFNPKVIQVYDYGIKPAVEAAGFKPYRVDRGNFLGKIDDQIIAEIRRSRFLIADMTHGDGGARGSVYFEAGFALGLGIPVIYTCRSDMYDFLHFDTRQFPHIEWKKEDVEAFRQDLENRIRATIV
ncbi:MAG: hypothetical protein OXF62_19315 [Caldilineaceae bacterium]|nr:hypothetical protein [Caldilineaceae bacterium]